MENENDILWHEIIFTNEETQIITIRTGKQQLNMYKELPSRE